MKQQSGQGKRFRSQFTPEQLDALEERYQQNNFIDGAERDLFSQQIGLGSKTVRFWFKNRRAKAIRTGEKVSDKPFDEPTSFSTKIARNEKLMEECRSTTKQLVSLVDKKEADNYLQKPQTSFSWINNKKRNLIMKN